jgi:YesN/AraC family two-component response regulator
MKKILVIEDEAQNRNSLLKYLKAEGFDAIGMENSGVGLKQPQEQLPDLVLCDIRMLELDGYGVLAALHQNPVTARITFIFLTVKGTEAELRQGMELEADDYLTKPSTVEELLKAIAVHLEKQATLKPCCAAESHRVSEPPPADTATSADPQSIFPSTPDLSEVFQFIEANYHQPIGLSEVAEAVGYCPAYLTDLVRRQTGQPVKRWIVQRRMAAACSLLLETNQSVEQIAEAVGYNNVGCFFRQFRISFGMTPQVWRNAQRIQSSTKQN